MTDKRIGIRADTLADCQMYRKAVAAGEHPSSIVGELAAMHGVQRPAIWRRLRSGGVLPPYVARVQNGRGRPVGAGEPGYTNNRRKKAVEVAAQRAAADEMLHFVDRDPCFLCGVRADLGCAHRRVA